VSDVPVNPFASSLWIDQPDAAEKIDRAARARKITEEERDLLEHFRAHGYLRISLDPQQEPLDELVADLDRLWSEKPADLLYASAHPFLRRMSVADPAHDRRPGYRIQELHSHSRAGRRLYLHPRLHAIAALILGQHPVAIQSILFEYGSAQRLHRDPVFVQTSAPGHLVAAWIALEDVHPDSGPLLYVPGSHTFPPYQYRPGMYRFDSRILGEKEIRQEEEWRERQMEERNLKPAIFTAKKGEVLFWHAGLYHGGDAIGDPHRTRKSFVVHYSTRATHHVCASTFAEISAEGETLVVKGTHRMIQDGKAVGFANPICRREVQWWPTLRNRLGALWTR
jgi:phytanoyl-CoA hydroxylase